MSRFRKLKIGDICEIKTPAGLAYVQYTHHGEHMGELVRVLPGIYSSRPADFSTLAKQKELYFAFYILRYALRDKDAEIVSNQPVPEWAQPFPIMRRAGYIARGKVHSWIIGHPLRIRTVEEIRQALHVRQLTPEQKKLSIDSLWPHPVMVEKIVEGWTPERDEELMAAAWKESQARKDPKVAHEPTSPATLEHFLYFPKKKHAEEAARQLKAKGWEVEVRMGADHENWLVLAKQPAPIDEDVEDIRDELERLAEDLYGEYDGWGAPL